MKSVMHFSKFATSLNLSRDRLRPFVEAGVVDVESLLDLEKVLKRREDLLEMDEISVDTLKDHLTQLAYLSSDEMPVMSKWLTSKACGDFLGIHHASAAKMFVSGEIPTFKTVQGREHTTTQAAIAAFEARKAGIVYAPATKPETLIQPQPESKKVWQEDVDEAWDAGIGKAKAKAKAKPEPKPDPNLEEEAGKVLTPEEEAAIVKDLQARARAGYEEAELAKAKARRDALAKLTPEEIEAQKAADAAKRAERLKQFMDKPRS